jgi:hypothetical protein
MVNVGLELPGRDLVAQSVKLPITRRNDDIPSSSLHQF